MNWIKIFLKIWINHDLEWIEIQHEATQEDNNKNLN